MRVGIIGLGRMGEGMSRRLIKAGIETWGYRRNLEKANEAYQKGYVSGVANDFDALVRMVQDNHVVEKCPAIFMMVVPAETVTTTIEQLLEAGVTKGDIIIDHGNSNFKDSRQRAQALARVGIHYIDCGTSGGVYGLERGYCLMVGGDIHAVKTCSPIFNALAPGVEAAPRTDCESPVTSAEHGWLHCGRWSRALCQNGSQRSRVWRHASVC